MNSLLHTWLQPLQPYLNIPDLIELSAVQSGQVQLECAPDGYTQHSAPELTLHYWEMLCHALAHHQGLTFDVIKQPRLSVMLPQGHRFEAMLGSTVESGISVSIRIKRSLGFELEAFGLHGELKQRLLAMIGQGANILISGGTSSGKTTFLNHLIPAIPLSQRILVVEDTRELHVPHPNHLYYTLSRNEENPVVGYPQMIDHMMRSRPDMIIMGELSLSNAYPLLRLLNSGHAGLLCTLHANSPDAALAWAIPQNIAFAGHTLTGVKEFLYQAVDAVIQLHRRESRRHIHEILFPKSGEHILLGSKA